LILKNSIVKPKRIWIDLANSPHVLFFKPIISEFEAQGHTVIISARDFAQTISLAKNHNMKFTVIGEHAGRGLFSKGTNLVGRALNLVRFARNNRVDMAVHHNSYAQAVAASMMRIPSVALMDYEHQPANHLAFRLANKVIVPEVFPDSYLRKFGAKPRKVLKYKGFKEESYLSTFEPETGFLEKLGIDSSNTIVTLRPPATMALYHRFDNPVFDAAIDYISQQSGVTAVLIPRSPEQKEFLIKKQLSNVVIPETAIDGLNLLYYSDLVIGAGGTMNREAAILGTPVYTIFYGEMGAVDVSLVENGRMLRLTEPSQIKQIVLEKRTNRAQYIPEKGTFVKNLVELIMS
jgi:predicted glycosyltransferase